MGQVWKWFSRLCTVILHHGGKCRGFPRRSVVVSLQPAPRWGERLSSELELLVAGLGTSPLSMTGSLDTHFECVGCCDVTPLSLLLARALPSTLPPRAAASLTFNELFACLECGFYILHPKFWVLCSEERRRIWRVRGDFRVLEIRAASYKNADCEWRLPCCFQNRLNRVYGWLSPRRKKYIQTCLLFFPISLIPPWILFWLGFWITDSFVCFHYQITEQNLSYTVCTESN